MAQTIKSSTTKAAKEKADKVYATFKNLCSWRENEMSGAFLEKMCQDLIAWADLPSSLKITQFMREYGIPEKTFYRTVHSNADFKEAYWYALTAIGDKREIGALKREYDAGTVDKTISHYCSVNAAAEERRAKLKREEQGSSIEDLTNCVQALVQQKWGDKNEKENEEKI
ncbi:MAG: hypothetical protein ABSB40_12175 [Nitrososphaeria archaeon]|jgi:hypothetical protein